MSYKDQFTDLDIAKSAMLNAASHHIIGQMNKVMGSWAKFIAHHMPERAADVSSDFQQVSDMVTGTLAKVDVQAQELLNIYNGDRKTDKPEGA